MQEFLELYNSLQSISKHNPLYAIKHEHCQQQLSLLKSNENMSFEDYRNYQNSLNRYSTEKMHFSAILIFHETCTDEGSCNEYNTVLQERETLRSFYAEYRKYRTETPEPFRENFKNLIDKVNSLAEGDSEEFWDYFFLLRNCIFYTKFGSSNYAVLKDSISPILQLYKYYCKRKEEIVDEFVQEKMDYFGEVSGSYNKVDLAEAYLVKEYLMDYSNDNLFNYFFEVINNIFNARDFSCSDFIRLEQTRNQIVSDKSMSETVDLFLQLTNEELTDYYWILDEPYLKQAYNDVVELFNTINDYTLGQKCIQQWFRTLETSKLLICSKEELETELYQVITMLENCDIEVNDKEDYYKLIAQRWKEVRT